MQAKISYSWHCRLHEYYYTKVCPLVMFNQKVSPCQEWRKKFLKISPNMRYVIKKTNSIVSHKSEWRFMITSATGFLWTMKQEWLHDTVDTHPFPGSKMSSFPITCVLQQFICQNCAHQWLNSSHCHIFINHIFSNHIF